MKFRLLFIVIVVFLWPIGPVFAQVEGQSQIVITEFLPNPEGTDTDLEWLELYNPGPQDVILATYSLKVNEKQFYSFEAESIISANGYLVINLPKAPLPNCSSQPCSIDLELLDADEVVDMVTYEKTVTGKSWSRTAEGEWTLDYDPSPGAENKPREVTKTLQISEVYAAPVSGQAEWLELINYGGKEVDLEGWYIADKTGKARLTGKIPPNTYLVIEDLGISLNNSDERLILYAPDSVKIDEFEYKSSFKGASLMRLGSDIVITTSVTPGSVNVFTALITEKEDTAEEKVVVEQKVPREVKASPPVPTIDYPLPSDTIHRLPSLITHGLVEIKTMGVSIYLLCLGMILLWKTGYLHKYYNWWISG